MAARKKHAAQANGAHSAPHPAASPPPAPIPAPPADGPPVAVWAALTAAPGATAPTPGESTAPGGDAVPDSSAPAGHPAPGPGTPGDDADSAPAGKAAAPAGAHGKQLPTQAGEAAELLREVTRTAAAAGVALDGGDTAAALARTDAVCAAATQARRLVKAATAGRRPRGTGGPAARPGQLRDLVQANWALTRTPSSPRTPSAVP